MTRDLELSDDPIGRLGVPAEGARADRPLDRAHPQARPSTPRPPCTKLTNNSSSPRVTSTRTSNCRHLTRLDLAYARGEISEKPERDPGADLIARKGDEHEAKYLKHLRAESRESIEIALRDEKDPKLRIKALEEAAAATEEAMRAGAESSTRRPLPAALAGPRRLPRACRAALRAGGWSYEVADTKLARRTKPYFLLQLCCTPSC